MSVSYALDAAHGSMTVDDQPLVFHCNHYNRFLQYTIQSSFYVPAADILTRAAAEVAYRTIRAHAAAHPELDRAGLIAHAEDVYRSGGYGLLPLARAADLAMGASCVLLVESSHYGSALRLNFEPPMAPSEFFDLGYALGALSAAYGEPFGGELSGLSIAMGDACTELTVRRGDQAFAWILDDAARPVDAQRFPGVDAEAPAKTFAPHIDEDLIVGTLAGVPLLGAPDTGLIEAFGVHLTRMYADYYCLISYRFEQHLHGRLQGVPDLADLLRFSYPTLLYYEQYFNLQGLDLIQAMLIEAGHVCGFNTMGGIMTSDAWKSLVMPMFRTRDDWIQGIVSCINALGWGVWRVTELVPGERLVIRAYRPYESLGHLRWFGAADHGVDYCMLGVACALMNLLYEGDVTSYPTLDDAYYRRVNRSKDSFWGTQTRCVASGDEYSEVVVSRQVRH